MAYTKTHAAIRSSLSVTVATLATELAGLATSVARATSLGTISTGDGGAGSTGEIGIAFTALEELLDDEAGDPDYSVPLALRLTTQTQQFKTGGSTFDAGHPISVSIFNLLPRPLVMLYRSGMAPLDVSDKATAGAATYSNSVSTSAAQSSFSTLTVDLSGVAYTGPVSAAPVDPTLNRIDVSNPLDAGGGTLSVNFLVATA